MKFLFILLFLIPLQSPAQDLVSIVAKTNVGTIVLSDNYIQFDNIGIQRSELTRTEDCCYDLYAWKWTISQSVFKFERSRSEKIFLNRYSKKTSEKTGKFRVYKYQLNFTKT